MISLAAQLFSKKTYCKDTQDNETRGVSPWCTWHSWIRYSGRFALNKKTELIRLSKAEIIKAIRLSIDIQGGSPTSPRQRYVRCFASICLALLKGRYSGRFAMKKKKEEIHLPEDEITDANRLFKDIKAIHLSKTRKSHSKCVFHLEETRGDLPC